jgi:TonB-dependent SusC/RagA subfamily outer membrane receptor
MKGKIILFLAAGLMAYNIASGQEEISWRVVTGTVTDVKENPVKGAVILADRENTGISTDRKGNFRIKIGPMVRMIGVYSTKNGSAETDVTGQTTLSMVLDGTFRIMDFVPGEPAGEEMVNIGYGTVSKKEMSMGIGYIDATEDKNASYPNIYEMIRGQVAGVQVNGTTIIIRGHSSINSSSEPLYVVDGMVVPTIAQISPREVKDITVLKGADAAIYGVRGANGVIVITLKGSR